METQRINAYKTAYNIIYFIEQQTDGDSHWYTVGNTYEKYEYAELTVNLFNIRQIADKIGA